MIGRNTSTCAGAVMSIQILMAAAAVAAPTLFGGLEKGGQSGAGPGGLELFDPLARPRQLAPGLAQLLLEPAHLGGVPGAGLGGSPLDARELEGVLRARVGGLDRLGRRR